MLVCGLSFETHQCSHSPRRGLSRHLVFQRLSVVETDAVMSASYCVEFGVRR